jgi:nucleoside-diphosphate-sugar epimerase
MRIFVTGATGYVGGGVARALRRAGHEVFGLCRSAEKGRSLARAEIHPVLGDMSTHLSYAVPLAECAVLVHCAADFTSDAVAADRVVVDAFVAAAASAPKTLVYTSGVWVIGNTGDHAAEETDPLRPLAKVAWRPAHEQRILTASGARSIVLRPGCVYGAAGGLTGAWFAEARNEKAIAIVGDGKQRWAMVHVDDLADVYVRAVESSLSGEVFNFADASRATVGEMAGAAARAAGHPGALSYLPLVEAAKTMGAFAECLAVDQRVNSQKAERLLGWKPRHHGFVDEVGLFFEAWKAGQGT